MTTNESADTRILGRLLQAEDGTGIVRIQDSFDADADDVWSALTDPVRLAGWACEVDGDLRAGGEFRLRFLASGWEGTGRVEVCDRPRRLLVMTSEAGGSGERAIDVMLAADGRQTILVREQAGIPLDHLPVFGAGIQVEIEDLAAYLAGRERCESDSRMSALVPAYEEMAAGLRRADPPGHRFGSAMNRTGAPTKDGSHG